MIIASISDKLHTLINNTNKFYYFFLLPLEEPSPSFSTWGGVIFIFKIPWNITPHITIENIKIQDIRLRLIVISETPGLAEKLRRMFPVKNAEIHVISPERFHTPPPFAPPEFLEAKEFMNFENVLELNVDDEELVMIPPFIGGSSSVLNTRNKGAIMHMKMFSQMHIRRLFEGEDFCPPSPPAHKKKR